MKAVLETAGTALQSYTGQLKTQGWPGLKCVPGQPGLLSETGKKVKGIEHKKNKLSTLESSAWQLNQNVLVMFWQSPLE